jgi:hypothetical protein
VQEQSTLGGVPVGTSPTRLVVSRTSSSTTSGASGTDNRAQRPDQPSGVQTRRTSKRRQPVDYVFNTQCRSSSPCGYSGRATGRGSTRSTRRTSGLAAS